MTDFSVTESRRRETSALGRFAERHGGNVLLGLFSICLMGLVTTPLTHTFGLVALVLGLALLMNLLGRQI
jgi:hypothetical protein